MFSILRILTLTLLVLTVLTTGCSKKSTTPTVSHVPGYAVTCIGVLPAVTALNFDEPLPVGETKQLEDGVRVLDRLLKEHFMSRTDVRLVSDGQISGMDENLPAQPLPRARVIAERLSCNAILETTLRRYKARVGGKYTAKDPASVAFDYRLIAIPEGTILCKGTFDKVQQSVMENLYNLKSASEHAFTWVPAEQLMREGLEEKLGECPYLVADE